jgi:cobalt-zinc-cadmium efflux system membrane fusion protein
MLQPVRHSYLSFSRSGFKFSVALALLTSLLVIASPSGFFAGTSEILWAAGTESEPKMAAATADAASGDDSRATPVVVEKTIVADISRQLETSGDVLPFLGADIHPKTAGEIIKINVSEGSLVQPGDLLAEIDHRILDAQLEQAQAAVTVAKASVEVQAVLVKTSQSALVSAKAQASAAKTQAGNMASTKKRFEELLKEGAVSEQQFDDVSAQHDAAQAQLVSAESAIRQAEDGIQSSQVTLKVRNAQLAQANSNLHAAEVHRENAFVRAPFAGIITARHADPGAMANLGQPIFRLEQMNPVKIIGSLVEKDLMLLTAGKTEASVRADILDREFKGTVARVYPAIATKTRTGQFEIVLPNPEDVLRSGMFTKILLYLETVNNAVVVSKDSLLNQNGKMVAIRVNKNNIAERVPVVVGIVQNSRAQILEGLQPGDLIISQGAELIRTGSKVKAIMEDNQQ